MAVFLSRDIHLPLSLFLPCSISHSPMTNKAALSAERGAGAARWLRGAHHHILLPVFCLFFFFLCHYSCWHYSAHSLLNPSSHLSSSQPVTLLLVIREASQGRCMWHLSQHMVHLLLGGALCVSASRFSMCACVRARGGCWLFSCPIKQGPRLMLLAWANTVKQGFRMADTLLSEQMVPCRQDCCKV